MPTSLSWTSTKVKNIRPTWSSTPLAYCYVIKAEAVVSPINFVFLGFLRVTARLAARDFHKFLHTAEI